MGVIQNSVNNAMWAIGASLKVSPALQAMQSNIKKELRDSYKKDKPTQAPKDAQQQAQPQTEQQPAEPTQTANKMATQKAVESLKQRTEELNMHKKSMVQIGGKFLTYEQINSFPNSIKKQLLKGDENGK